MQTTGAESTEDDGAVSARARRLVIAGLMLALTLPSLDLLVVATAGKAIADDVGKLSQLSWLFISYQLTLVAFMPLFGKLGDIYGRKRTIQSSIVLFVAASVFTGLATNFPMLVLGRALQGIGGGGISGLSQAVIADIVPPRHRGRYAWITPTVFTIVSMLGPLMGGLFVDHLSWRWIFFINVPLGIVAWFFIAVAFQVPTDRVRHHVDIVGALLLVVAVSAIVFAASTAGDQFEWTSPIVIGDDRRRPRSVGALFVRLRDAPERAGLPPQPAPRPAGAGVHGDDLLHRLGQLRARHLLAAVPAGGDRHQRDPRRVLALSRRRSGSSSPPRSSAARSARTAATAGIRSSA